MTKDEPSTADYRRWWRLRWLSAIEAFADGDTQRTRWLDPFEANPFYSYAECMCGYFDDVQMSGSGVFERLIAERWISLDERDAVTEFHEAADAHSPPGDDHWDIPAILADPAWQEVVQLAQAAQRSLLVLLVDDDEVAALTLPRVWVQTGAGSFASDTSTIVRLTNDRPN